MIWFGKSDLTFSFRLRGALLENLTKEDEELLGVSAQDMLDDEISWLSNFTLTRPRSRHRKESEVVTERRNADDTLCAGMHFNISI